MEALSGPVAHEEPEADASCTDDGWCRLRPSVPLSGGTAVWTSGPDDVWVASERLYRFDGERWSSVALPVAGAVTEVWGRARDEVYAVVDRALLRWDGLAWTDLQAPEQEWTRNAVWASAPDDVWLGGRYRSWHYDGATWTESPRSFVAIAGDDDIGLYAIGGDRIKLFRLEDGEWVRAWGDWHGRRTFQTLAVGGGEVVLTGFPGFHAAHRDDRWVDLPIDQHHAGALWVTPNGTHLRQGSRGTMLHVHGSTIEDHPIPPELEVVDIHGVGDDFAIAVGDRGVLRWDGARWRSMTELHPNLTRVRAVGDGVAIMGRDSLLRFEGGEWSEPASADALRATWGSGPDDVWAVGDGGRVLRWDGDRVQRLEPPTQHTLRALWGDAADAVWAVGDAGTILQWDGSRWSAEDSGTEQALYAVWGTGPGDVWAGGSGGVLLHRDSDGWSVVPHALAQPIRALGGYATDDVWAAGLGGGLERFDGRSWHRRPSVDDSPTALVALGPHGVLVAGQNPRVRDPYTGWDDTQGLHSMNAIAAAGDTLFAAGPRGRVARRTDPESYWDETQVEHVALHGVWAARPDLAFAVGDGESIFQFDGARWTRVHGDAVRHPYNALVEVGDAAIALTYGGLEWIGVDGPLPEDRTGFLGIAGTPEGEAWVVGRFPVVLHFDGERWREEPLEVEPGRAPGFIRARGDAVVAWSDHYQGPAIWHRVDGRWESVPSPTYVSDIHPGPDGTLTMILRRGDVRHFDGERWVLRTDPRSYFVRVRVVEGTHAVAMSISDVAYFDSRGWRAVAGPPGAPRDVWAFAEDDLWAVTTEGAWRSNGRGWTRVRDPGAVAVWGPDSSAVFVAFEDGRVDRFDGTSWSESRAAGGGARALAGTDARNVVVLGDRLIARFDGSGWTDLALPDGDGTLSSPQLAPGPRLLVLQRNHGVLEHTGGAWRAVGPPIEATNLAVGVDGSVTVLSYARARQLVGGQWAPMDAPSPMSALAAAHRHHVFVVGGEGQRWRWDGTRWHDGRRGPRDATVGGSWSASPDRFIVVGSRGFARHGARWGWPRIYMGTDAHLRSVHGASATEAWAVGTDGAIMRWDGAGWEPEASGTEAQLNDVRVVGSWVYAVGDDGTVLRRAR